MHLTFLSVKKTNPNGTKYQENISQFVVREMKRLLRMCDIRHQNVRMDGAYSDLTSPTVNGLTDIR